MHSDPSILVIGNFATMTLLTKNSFLDEINKQYVVTAKAKGLTNHRALLVPCRLLLLDEPAASLDAHSEQRVMQALTHASSEQTTLLVTHQLEGLADWDDVWVMQDGQIIEQGDYATLARAGGVFSALLAHRHRGAPSSHRADRKLGHTFCRGAQAPRHFAG